MKIKQLIPITMILISACASNSGDRRPSRPRNIISQEEIQGMATALNAYDIVSFGRPAWLRARDKTPSVYLNGVQLGGLDQLNNISSASILELRLLTPSEAALLYGTGAGMGGLIDVKIR